MDAQGPPGTGKTSAIIGMVSALLARNAEVAAQRQEQPASKPRAVSWEGDGNKGSPDRDSSVPAARVLVCAQSNAAIDELIARLASPGLITPGKPTPAQASLHLRAILLPSPPLFPHCMLDAGGGCPRCIPQLKFSWWWVRLLHRHLDMQLSVTLVKTEHCVGLHPAASSYRPNWQQKHSGQPGHRAASPMQRFRSTAASPLPPRQELRDRVRARPGCRL